MTKDYSFEIIKDISNKYSDAFTKIIEKIKRLLKEKDFNEATLKREIQKIIKSEIDDIKIETELAKTLMSAANSNIYEWIKTLRESGVVVDEILITKLLVKSRKQIKLAYRQLLSNAKSMESQIMKSAGKIANDILAEIVAAKSEGVSIPESIKNVGGLIKDFNFVDKAGRTWNPQSYMEMAARSQSNSINADISKNLSNSIDNDFRIIDVQGGACPTCYEFTDAVISMNIDATNEEITEITDDGFKYYGTYEDAVGEGFDHPNCRCIINVYIVGVSVHSVNDSESVNSENYQDRQTQRGMERNIRQWKLKEAGALTEKEEKAAAKKVKEWQSKLNDLTKEKGLSRMRWREQISFNTTSDGKWERDWILGKTKELDTEFIKDIL